MEINLNLIKKALGEQNKSQAELAEYLGINKNTMASIFKKNDCSIRQFIKMVKFLECGGNKVSDFIRVNGQLLSEYVQLIQERNDYYSQKIMFLKDLRCQLADKEKVIRLYEQKEKAKQEHKEEIDELAGQLNTAQRANYR